MKTTVVIPNYNGISYLQDCLTFLKRSKGTAFATIVVDNGSTDGSQKMVKERFPEVKLVELPENTGFSHAVNVGIKQAKTPYVLLLNNDTVVEHDFVAELEKAMDENPDYFSFSSKMLSMKQPDVIDDAGDYYCALGWAFAGGKGKPAERFTTQRDVFAACGGASIYRKEVFRSIGYFDVLHFAYLEDVDVGYRARLRGYKNGYCPKAVVYHAGSGFSGSRYNEFKVNLSSQNSVYLIAKNMPLLQLLINLPFLLAGFFIKTLFFVKKGFGTTYLKGLWKGVRLSLSREGRRKKLPFRMKYGLCYVKVQLELWYNLLRRLAEG
nr:glycosyltransferase family 2 protein [Lachnospiraceae bacterium]